jgi:hypothetical protein
MTKTTLVALCSLASVVACVADPVRKSKRGTIDVMTAGAAGATADPSGAAGAAPDPTGAAGTSDPSGAGGTGTTDPTGAGGVPASAAGAGGAPASATGAGGTPVSPTGVGGTGGTPASPVDAGGGSPGAGGATSDAGAPANLETSGPVTPPITDPCDHRAWTFTPSVVCTTTCAAMADAMKLPANAIDGNTATRYTTGLTQGSKGPELAILAFPKPVTLTGLNLFTKGGDGPISYLVEFSLDGANFSFFNPSAMGAGSDNLTVTFPGPTKLLALRITQTGVKKSNWWSIHELTVTGCAPAQ